MIRGVFLSMQALVYGPEQAELLSEILKGESIEVSAADVADALSRLPAGLTAARFAIRTEEQENDYNRAMLPILLSNLGVVEPTNALIMRLVETVYDYHAYYSLYPEVLPVLEQLKERGLTLAVVANWEPSLARFVREFELDGSFAAVISSMAAGAAKPDPYLFRQALRETGLSADETLHVGPSLPEDVTGAMAAGIRPVWLNRTSIPTGHEVLSINDLRGLLLLVSGASQADA